MQEDSPGGGGKRTRNERYSTPTRPKKLSVSAAKQKAKEFATKDDKTTRALAKQAILKELSANLVVRAQGVAPQERRKVEKTGDTSGMQQEKLKAIGCAWLCLFKFIWREIQILAVIVAMVIINNNKKLASFSKIILGY